MCSAALRGAVYGVVCVALLAVAGCHSAYIEAVVKNAGGAPVSLVEVDYPSASFGRETLAAGAEYHYRFKVLGAGATKALWTDASHHEHSTPGPTLKEGDEGRLTVTVGLASAQWDLALKNR
ncbi:MAG: hypothetical protein M3R43_07260 [Acidobacteriota bacterium]|nr:hypothetical protein [Acidobacteriota bacterium]